MSLFKFMTFPTRKCLAPRFVRILSTASNPYPFPSSSNPSPYQIFHLAPGATQNDVKQRYYDLVRLYHPDSPSCRKLHPNSSIRQNRFHAITAAYEALQKGHQMHASNDHNSHRDALRRAYRRRKVMSDNSVLYDAWKERFLAALLLLTFIAAMAQSIALRRQAAAELKARKRLPPLEDTDSSTSRNAV
ncbi:hypothetical protein BD410DRAFT_577541 [Rickenella mellea]|uniref:J domain-containing protein n=1 Tax=Rickenella mellea TaxID=50990 RepID=A0A4Y7QHJ6_9AGAM|nr:hypothetical protein BD410DRAFT_577541 [Rickenella mellea]